MNKVYRMQCMLGTELQHDLKPLTEAETIELLGSLAERMVVENERTRFVEQAMIKMDYRARGTELPFTNHAGTATAIFSRTK